MNTERPQVGIGVIIRKEGRVLLGKRTGSHANGTWGFAGGKLEFGETPEACAERETLEETGVRIKNINRGSWTNDVYESENRHFVTLFMLSDWDSGEPRLMEPDKFEKWEWFDWNNLPDSLMPPIVQLVQSGFNPFS